MNLVPSKFYSNDYFLYYKQLSTFFVVVAIPLAALITLNWMIWGRLKVIYGPFFLKETFFKTMTCILLIGLSPRSKPFGKTATENNSRNHFVAGYRHYFCRLQFCQTGRKWISSGPGKLIKFIKQPYNI